MKQYNNDNDNVIQVLFFFSRSLVLTQKDDLPKKWCNQNCVIFVQARPFTISVFLGSLR